MLNIGFKVPLTPADLSSCDMFFLNSLIQKVITRHTSDKIEDTVLKQSLPRNTLQTLVINLYSLPSKLLLHSTHITYHESIKYEQM